MSDYKTTKQILEDSHELLLTVEVAQEKVEKELRNLAKKTGKRMNIPGFRPGKAPVNLIIARLGREYLMQEMSDELADDAYQEALKTVEDEPVISGAALSEVRMDPLTYEFVLPLRPDVDPGDYRNIRVTMDEVDEAEVLKMVEEELQRFQEQSKVWKPVEDRPVQYGDLVTLGIKLSVDGKVELNQDEWDLIPSETDYTLSPEFDANIIGLKIGEHKTFTINFPADGSTAWSGKEGVFEVEIKGVKAEELPELTDELVSENTDYETVDAFKEMLSQAARQQLEGEAETKFQAALLEDLKARAQLRYSPKTLAQEVVRLEAEREDLYKSYGFGSTDELLKLQGKTREQYREELEPEAKARLEEELLLDAVAEKEQLAVGDDELEKYIRDAGLDDEKTQELVDRLQEDEFYRLYIRQLLLRKKAHELLSAIARGEDIPEPGQHSVEEASQEPAEAPEKKPKSKAKAARKTAKKSAKAKTTKSAPKAEAKKKATRAAKKSSKETDATEKTSE